VKQDYLDFTKANSVLFPQDGGVLYHCTLDVRNGVYSDKADAIIRDVIEKLEKFYPDRSLAIITPFRDSVKELQKRFCTSDLELDITIETIDRIQGMTVDYAILYIPGRNPGFGSAGSIGESAHDCTGEFRAGETGSCNPAGAFVGRYVRMAVFVPCFRATVLPVI
jgi:hypothetical protein